jgi:hypothetical protein
MVWGHGNRVCLLDRRGVWELARPNLTGDNTAPSRNPTVARCAMLLLYGICCRSELGAQPCRSRQLSGQSRSEAEEKWWAISTTFPFS